jgi:adenosylhomocysteine nucleosidase
MQSPTLLILTAVILEARAIAAALEMPCPTPGHPTSRKFGELSVFLHLAGIRAHNLPAEGASWVVMAGLAGALDPSLAVGDIVIDDFPDALGEPPPCHRGHIISSDEIVATPAEKAELRRATGAMAVDMETATVRDWAKRQNAAFIALRAISDRADQCLDPTMLRMVNGWGKPKSLAIARELICRPTLIPSLLRLGADSKFAAHCLGAAVQSFVVTATTTVR